MNRTCRQFMNANPGARAECAAKRAQKTRCRDCPQKIRSNLITAIASLPHDITGERVLIFLDRNKPGPAFSQLLDAIMEVLP